MGNFKSRYLPFGELPQNIVGRIFSRQWKKRLQLVPDETIKGVKEIEKEHGVKVYLVTEKSHIEHKTLSKLSGSSIGKYICLEDTDTLDTVKHELGHTKQSKKWKWLYLPVIGIASAIFCNMWDRWFHKDWKYSDRVKWYYSRWPESEADRNGNVIRPWTI
jgi:hypothetical protein